MLKKKKTITYLPCCQFRLLFTLSSRTNLAIPIKLKHYKK